MEPREKDQKEQKQQSNVDNQKVPARGVGDESKPNQRPTQDPDAMDNDPDERERRSA